MIRGGISEKMIQVSLFTKQKQTHTENKLWLSKGKGGWE